jgi:DNA-binding GntR family transcriptional regulator
VQYLAIREAIIEQIDTGALAAKQKLPSERQLAGAFNTTRITLREALSLLEAEGRIYREDRRGWFIAPRALEFDPLSLLDFSAQAKEQDFTPGVKLIKAQTGFGNKKISALLELGAFTQVHSIERLLQLNDSAVAYAEHYFIGEYYPDLLKSDLSQDLETQNAKTNPASVSFELIHGSFLKDKAKALNIKSGSPALVLSQIYRDSQNRPLYASLLYWRLEAVRLKAINFF